MKSENLHVLATKYINAETSLEEEAELKNKLMEQECPPELDSLKLIFEYIGVQKSRTDVPQFENPSVLKKPGRTGRIISLQWISIAASVVILAILAFFLSDTFTATTTDTYDDPTIAAQSAAEAIEILSLELNTGKTMALDQMKELDNLNKYLNIF